jgi:hypothetical protein
VKTQINTNYSDIADLTNADGEKITTEGINNVTAARDTAITAIADIIRQIDAIGFDATNPATTTFAAPSGISSPAEIIKSITDAVSSANYESSGPDPSGKSIDDLIKQLKLVDDTNPDKGYKLERGTDDEKLINMIYLIKSEEDLLKLRVIKNFTISNTYASKPEFLNKMDGNKIKNCTMLTNFELRLKPTHPNTLVNGFPIAPVLKKIFNKISVNSTSITNSDKIENKYLYKDLKKIYKTMKKYNLDSNYFNGEIRKLNSKYNIKINKKLLSKLLQ